ncbi:ATP-NAD kinase family protein [Arthrobacter sulfonylureivorans]|uniref:ATP-NAD kinase family protein n=1 Tax=Arthrobacter sulfonylureivorans TaxID=2486855 RepID=UPI0039E56C0A
MSTAAGPLRIGLIVNPVAGLGGPAGLKGSDGTDIQAEALRRGSVPRSAARMGRMLRELRRRDVPVWLLAAPGPLGEDAARAAGWEPDAVVPWPGATPHAPTTAADTTAAAAALTARGVDVLVFAGGDGTARDVAAGLGPDDVVLGLPAGVKMQSGVFARSPESAAGILADAARGVGTTSVAEVVDIDEQARREGIISSTLYGQLRVLGTRAQMQGGKVGSRSEPREVLGGIAAECAGRIDPEAMCLLGPGTTVAAVAAGMGLDSTLLGVDVLHRGRLVATDCSAAELHQVTAGHRLQVLLSPVGGQGFLLGRGNQQLDEALLARLSPAEMLIVCTPEKLGALGGGPFYVDVPGPDLAAALTGPRRVVTGRRQEAVVRLQAA